MPTFQKHIQFTFEGGWATDLGSGVPGLIPAADGVLRVPFLLDAENVFYALDGGPYKIPGARPQLSGALESGADVMGAIEYWRMGTAGTPAQYRVCHVGTKIYATSDATWVMSEIGSGFTSGAVPNYTLFDDLLIMANDSGTDAPQSWDGTTLQALAGSPPTFAFSCKHKNYTFAAGVISNPSRLYYSSSLNPEQWSGGTSGSIDIDPDDGDQIVGLVSHKDELWVFKGPNKGSIHRITGSSNSDWARVTFIEGIPAVWQNSIFKMGDDVGFLCSDSSVRTLSATAAYGDYRAAALTFPIQSWLDTHLNRGRLRRAWAVQAAGSSRVFITAAFDGSADNNGVLVLDMRFQPFRWSYVPAIDAACLFTYRDNVQSLKHVVGYTTYDGQIYKWDEAERAINDNTAIASTVTTPFFDFGAPDMWKTFVDASLQINPRNNGNISFRWTRDDNAQQSANVGQAGAAVLGVATSNQFTLDTSRLAGETTVSRFAQIEEGGEFRQIQFQFYNATVLEHVDLHGFAIRIEPGATGND